MRVVAVQTKEMHRAAWSAKPCRNRVDGSRYSILHAHGLKYPDFSLRRSAARALVYQGCPGSSLRRSAARALVYHGANGEWILSARHAVESDTKTLPKLLRTLGSHWKMKIQNEAWRSRLHLITPEAFAQALGQDHNREGEVGDPEPEATSVPGTMPAPCRFVLQLSKDFDARSRDMTAALQACR